jgi:hypothetical protein
MAGDLKVFQADADGVLTMGIQRPPTYVTGIDKLVQTVALVLMTNPGRSIIDEEKGGGVRALIGSNIDPDDPAELFADIRLMVDRTRDYVVQSQINTTRPTSERLSDLQLVDVVLDEYSSEVGILIAVVNEEQIASQAVVAIT